MSGQPEHDLLVRGNKSSSNSTFPGLDILAIFALLTGLHLAGLLPLHQPGLPHPFWIPVILSAVLYGIAPGVIAVALAVALDWALGWSPIVEYHDYYAYLLANLRGPILWLIAVGVLGQIRQRQMDAITEFRGEADERRAQALTLAERCQSLRRELAQLEHSISVSGGASAGQSLELLETLARAPADQLHEAFRRTLHRLLGAEGIEIVTLGRGEAENVAILEAIVARQRILTCARSDDAATLAGSAAMAAPLTGPDGGVLGVVLIREVDPACLSPAGEAALAVTCFIFARRLSGGGTPAAGAGAAGPPHESRQVQPIA